MAPTPDCVHPSLAATVADPSGKPPIKKSKAGPWRAAVLIGIHVLAAIHIAHWLSSGSTITPVEPSEGMDFAKKGVINAGAIFFALMLVTTLVFGRFFCGWACHLVALQDLCRWMLGKIGIRPKPFRSRLLVFVPLIAAVYMFIGPFIERAVLGLGWQYEGAELTREEFWSTFPPLWQAIVTFLVCGFLIVYFLGSKGFCTYACPYGGFFGVIDKVAPGRIRVTDACEGCGHCTQTCSSNVLVHKEVREHKMVVDPGCMKCMDCVSVCPKEALYFGMGKPPVGVVKAFLVLLAGVAGLGLAIGNGLLLESLFGLSFKWGLWIAVGALLAGFTLLQKHPGRTFDYTVTEEALLAGTFIVALLSFRGLYRFVPFLLALGIAGILAFSCLQVLRLFTRRSVSMQGVRLKDKGAWRPAGRVFLASAIGFAVFWGHSAYVNYHWTRADALIRDVDHRVHGSLRESWFQTPPDARAALVAPELGQAVRQAAEHVDAAQETGLVPYRPRLQTYAWMCLIEGNAAAFEELLRRAIERWPSDDLSRLDLARHLANSGRPDEAIAQLRELLEDKPDRALARIELARLLAGRGDGPGAEATLMAGVALPEPSARLEQELGIFFSYQGRLDEAIEHFARATELAPDVVETRQNLAGALCQAGRLDEGIAVYDALIAEDPQNVEVRFLVSQFLSGAQRHEDARQHILRALVIEPEAPALHVRMSEILTALGDEEGAARHRQRAQELIENR